MKHSNRPRVSNGRSNSITQAEILEPKDIFSAETFHQLQLKKALYGLTKKTQLKEENFTEPASTAAAGDDDLMSQPATKQSSQ